MNKNQLLIVNIAALFLVLFLSSINLNTRIRKLEQENRDLQWEVEEHELSIQRIAEKNTMQDTILNKLNREYQMREHERAQIQTRNYEGTDGRRIYVTEVVAENFQILEKRDNSGNQNSMMEQMPPSHASNPMDISDDDLPF